ncbi:MAG TPA: DUF742 domain-containing protein [Streptosporangiaceae bacterium]|nr:DUF742 domain-containing protein [Streptosporangiaceae bacterium]
MEPRHDDWVRHSAGPVVRPYALTAGRTRPSGTSIDLIALVTAVRRASRERRELEHEHLRVLRLCRLPISVADLASDLDLPLGVVRILLADLREQGLVSIHQPAQAGLADVRILKEVADALRRL